MIPTVEAIVPFHDPPIQSPAPAISSLALSISGPVHNVPVFSFLLTSKIVKIVKVHFEWLTCSYMYQYFEFDVVIACWKNRMLRGFNTRRDIIYVNAASLVGITLVVNIASSGILNIFELFYYLNLYVI